jgi:hypothetical protein
MGTHCETQKGRIECYSSSTMFNVTALIYSSQLNPNSGYCYAMDRSQMWKTQAAATTFCTTVPGAKLATIKDAADLADLLSTFYNV